MIYVISELNKTRSLFYAKTPSFMRIQQTGTYSEENNWKIKTIQKHTQSKRSKFANSHLKFYFLFYASVGPT